MLTLAVLSASLILCGLAGAALVPLIAPPAAQPVANATRRLAEALAMPLVAGILAVYVALLVVGRFDRTALVVAALAAVGAVRIAVRARHAPKRSLRPDAAAAAAAAALAALAAPLAVIGAAAAFTPIEAWDARSIWFLHAKIMATLHGLVDSPAWRAPEYAFSNPFYPKLLPAVGALVAEAHGTWNEFLPKAGLVLLAVPAALATLSFASGRTTEWFLLLALPFAFGNMMSNGLADGYFGWYAALSALFAARFLAEHEGRDATQALLCLAVAASIKSEGLLLFVALAMTVVASSALTRRPPQFQLAHAGAAILAVAPVALWTVTRARWGMASTLHSNFGADLATRALQRVSDLPLILDWLVVQSDLWRFYALAAAALLLGAAYLRHVPSMASFICGASTLYLMGLTAIYAGTNVDLALLLDATYRRTTLPVALMLLCVVYAVLDAALARWSSGAAREVRRAAPE